MSYQNPDILLLSSPVGIDAVIQSYQQDFYNGLPWLEKSFGRAWELHEDDKKLPKAYMGLGEYMNVLPNDNLKSQAFIMARGKETSPELRIGGRERSLSFIFWVNLKAINGSKDLIYTEELRWEVEKIIQGNYLTKSIDAYFDERIEDIFLGYVSAKNPPPYLMYPYAGFRFDITVSYPQHNPCATYQSSMRPAIVTQDIDLVVGEVNAPVAGQNIFQDDRLKGRKIRLIRSGLKQFGEGDPNEWFYSFVSTTGTITVNPKWVDGEKISIEIYG